MSEQATMASVREALAQRSGTQAEDWFLAFRGRHALQVVFETLARAKGAGEVVTQLFTCCTAVDPIISSGHTPRYGDISAETLALDPAYLPVGEATRAVVAQHTFGIIDVPSTRALAEAAHAAGAVLVEDCAHCATRLACDDGGTPLADVSVHSFGVGKMAVSDFGGAVWINPAMEDAELRAALIAAFEALPAFDARLERATRSYGLSIRVLMHLPRPLRRALWDRLATARLFVPAVSSDERRGKVSYEPSLPGSFALQGMTSGIEGLAFEEDRSREATRIFLAALEPLASELGIPRAARGEAAPLLNLPLVLGSEASADALIERLCAEGCYCESWGRPLLYPGVLDEAAYGLDGDLSALPETVRLSQGVVPLITSVSPEDALRAARVVVDSLC